MAAAKTVQVILGVSARWIAKTRLKYPHDSHARVASSRRGRRVDMIISLIPRLLEDKRKNRSVSSCRYKLAN
jgi:hypothetical protein